MESLFPELAEDLSGLSDQEVDDQVQEHRDAAALIDADDEGFLKGMAAADVISEYERGVEQTEKLVAEKTARADAHENYTARKAELAARLTPTVDEDPGDETEEVVEEEALEVVAEAEAILEDEDKAEEAVVQERELVTAAVEPVRLRRPPMPSTQRQIPQEEPKKGTALVASGEMSLQFKDELTPTSLAQLVKAAATHHGPMPKIDPLGKYRFGGPEHKIARAEFELPEERQLDRNIDSNTEKIKAVVAASIPGGYGEYSLTAAGGLCAPLEPFYGMPNFATDAEPVWDSLPVFQARRGGVNTPEATTIGDITTAISSISEADDALGGTFATKSCQDLECPPYTEVAVQILAHCREYGNLNARAWPEKIAHENALTMAALARTSEMFMLERIKALSVNVTSGAETLGALIYLVDAITKSAYGIRSRLRMPRNARFRALLPAVVLDILLLDAIQNQFDRYQTRGDVDAYLRSTGIDPVYYLDGDFAAGVDQIPTTDQAAGALAAFPDTIQWALYAEGAFLGIDSGVLELGIVRDSELNSTNDFQVFGERFRNVARIGPAQSAYWETTDICANGNFPPAGTTRTCD